MESWLGMGEGTHPGAWYYLAVPPRVHHCRYLRVRRTTDCGSRRQKSAMGSKMDLIQSQKALEVNLRLTIYLLAAF